MARTATANHRTNLGYRRLWAKNHPYNNGQRLMFEHVMLAERAIGKSLPKGAVVHHVNGDRGDNSPENLVVCENQTYHFLLHRRQDALAACGNPNYRQCCFCKQWDEPNNIHQCRPTSTYHHKACAAEWQRELRRERRLLRKKQADHQYIEMTDHPTRKRR